MSPISPPVPALKARLVCRMRPGVTERFRIQGEEAWVGREPGLAVTVPLDGVSRRHARIVFDGKTYWIENKSPAGTFVNGTLVARERLRHLDVITLGKRVDLVFLLRDEAQSAITTDGIVRAALVPEGPDTTPFEIVPGEVLIGRSTANNLVAEASGAVSNVHARIERTPLQLILRDLGSSNGTYVNGERVMTALLKDGDVISLANVVSYRVILHRGEVVSPSVRIPIVELPSTEQGEKRLQFSPDWKTRYDWDSREIRSIAALHARLVEEDARRKALKATKEGSPEKPARAARPAPAAAPPASSPTPALPVAPIGEVRLSGPGGDLVVKEPGDYPLGRAKDSPLRVEHPTVSRRHARILLREDRAAAYLEDNGGANGTHLNGTAVEKRTRLSDGDRIGIGELELVVKLTKGSPSP